MAVAPWLAQGTDREAVTDGSRRWRSQTAGNAIQTDDSTPEGPEGNAVADFQTGNSTSSPSFWEGRTR